MRKTIVFSALAALIGLTAAAQASERMRAGMQDESHVTRQYGTEGRDVGERRERAEYADRDTDRGRRHEEAREHRDEAGERHDRD